MKKLLSIIFIAVFSMSIANAQNLKGKKLLKAVAVLGETGQTRTALDLINKNFKNSGKQEAEVALVLAKLQVKAMLLDSANLSLGIAEKSDDDDIVAGIAQLNPQIAELKEKYTIEIALGYKNLQDNKLDAAAMAFNEALKYDTGNYEAFLGLGEIEQLGGNHETAISVFKKTALKFTGGKKELAHVYEHLAEGYIAIRNSLKAIETCDLAMELDSENTEVIYLMGKAIYYQRNFHEAIDLFTTFLDAGYTNPNVNYYRGECYYETKKYKEAVADFTEAIKLDKEMHSAYILRGICYFNLKEFKIAEFDFKEVAKLSEKNFFAQNAVGMSLYYQDKFVEAIPYFEKAVANSTLNGYKYNLAMAYYKNNQLELSLKYFDELGVSARYGVSYNVMHCKVLMANNDYESAKVWMVASMKSNPFNREYLELSGEIYEKLGDVGESKNATSISNDMHGDSINLDLVFQ
jgi:tetratricopeptide (TPR) repeat protein